MIINVIEYLEEIAKRYPDRIAIEDEFNSNTFQGLKDNAIRSLIPKELCKHIVALSLDQEINLDNEQLSLFNAQDFY